MRARSLTHCRPEDVTIVRRASGDLVVKDEGAYFAAIDPTVTPELRREGIARELVSRVQRLRKELGLRGAVTESHFVCVWRSMILQEAVGQYREWIAEEVLALDVQVEVAPDGSEHRAAHLLDLDGRAVRVALTRIG